MTPEERAVVEQLRNLYEGLHDIYLDLLAACENNAQKRQVGDAMQRALKNYIDAQNSILGKSAELIAQTGETAEKAQKAIDKALKDLTDIKKTLNTITQWVNNVATAVAILA